MSSHWLIEPGVGDDVGGGMVRKLLATQTHGALCAAEATIPPGMFVPPHVHTREDEITLVLEGALDVVVGDEHLVARAGAYVVKPRGIAHGFWNAGTTATRVIELVTPGTLDGYFAELFTLATRIDLTDSERSRAIDEHHGAHGITFDAALAEAWIDRYGAPRRS